MYQQPYASELNPDIKVQSNEDDDNDYACLPNNDYDFTSVSSDEYEDTFPPDNEPERDAPLCDESDYETLSNVGDRYVDKVS